MIQDKGSVYCDSCYAAHEEDRDGELVHAEQTVESDDYIDLELMDILDADDDEGLF
jgi:hypothetical protein